MQGLLTLDQIAALVGVSQGHKVSSTLSRYGIEPADKHGRTRLYDLRQVAEVPIWSGILKNKKTEAASVAIRKQRSDRGVPRRYDARAVELATERARVLYLSSGMPNARQACVMALRALLQDAQASRVDVTPEAVQALGVEWFYKRWIMRRDSHAQGPFYSEGWAELWKQAYKQHDSSLNSVYSSRSWWQIAESAGWAGQGHGFGWMIGLDDRSADVYAIDPVTGTVKPNGIYVWDILTRALLWVEPTTEITTQAYMRAILGACWYHGFERMPLIVMENAKAAVSDRIPAMLEALYPPDEFARLRNDRNLRKLTNGAEPPFYRNVPHIARDLGKALVERSFGVVKREHDSYFSPTTFQGGNRDEAVQLHRNNQPWWFTASMSYPRFAVNRGEIPTTDEYFRSVYNWAQTTYIDEERDSLKAFAKAKCVAPTIRAMMEYYGYEEREPGMNIDMERFGRVIYEYTPKHAKRFFQVQHVGRIAPMIGSRRLNLVSVDIGPEIVGRRVGVCPVPGSDDHYIVVLFKHNTLNVDRYLTVARDLHAVTIDQAIEHRQVAQRVRTELREEITAQVTEIRGTNNLSLTPEIIRHIRNQPIETLPVGPGFMDDVPADDVVMIGMEEPDESEYIDDDIQRLIDL